MESAGIADPLEKMAIKSQSDHSDSGISEMLILIDTYFVIAMQIFYQYSYISSVQNLYVPVLVD